LVDYFLEISKNPKKYISDKCVCGCTIGNSGTNLIHSIFKSIDKEQAKYLKAINKMFAKKLNARVNKYVKKRESNYYFEWNLIFVIIVLMILVRYLYGS